MQVKLVLNSRAVRTLIDHFGSENVTILVPEDAQGFSKVSFEIKNDMDVLKVFHAGTDSGLELGLYGLKGKPQEDVAILERG
jgi:hypothetical protein